MLPCRLSSTTPAGSAARPDISLLALAMPSADIKPRTLYDKVFQDHIVNEREDGTILPYIGMAVGVFGSLCAELTLWQTVISSTKSHLPRHSKA